MVKILLNLSEKVTNLIFFAKITFHGGELARKFFHLSLKLLQKRLDWVTFCKSYTLKIFKYWLFEGPLPCLRMRVREQISSFFVFFSCFHVCVIRIGLRDASVVHETQSLPERLFLCTTDTTHSILHSF